MLTQSSIYKEYLDLMDTEAWKQYIKLKIYKLQQIYQIYIYIVLFSSFNFVLVFCYPYMYYLSVCMLSALVFRTRHPDG